MQRTLGIAPLGTREIPYSSFIPAVQAVEGARLVAVLSCDKARGVIFTQPYGIPIPLSPLRERAAGGGDFLQVGTPRSPPAPLRRKGEQNLFDTL